MNTSYYRRIAAALLFILCCGAVESRAQQADTLDQEPDSLMVPDTMTVPATKRLRPYGRFNYTYIRVAKLFPGKGFGNPAAAGFAGSENFSNKEAADHPYALGFESGNARHFMSLHLGTEMLKLAINSGIALQACGPRTVQQDKTTINSNGVYLIRLGLGPQLTFKPVADIRIGVYYRAGIAALYTDYIQEQASALAPELVRVDKVSVTLLNYCYNGDIGFDCAWHALSIGVSYSMLKCRPSSGVLFTTGDDNNSNVYTSAIMRSGKQDGAMIVTPVDPAIKFNRIGISVGFMF